MASKLRFVLDVEELDIRAIGETFLPRLCFETLGSDQSQESVYERQL